jgi:hypothetical protein
MRTACNKPTVVATLLGAALLTACGSRPTPTATPAAAAQASLTAAVVTPTTGPAPTTTTGPALAATGVTPPTGMATTGVATAALAGAGPAPAPASGCAPTGTGVPTGAASKQVIDVDGDGRPDTGWLSSDGNTFGITTASGATFSVPIELVGGGPRRVLVEDTDGHGTIAALASDGRTVELLVLHHCGLFPATNAQGARYEFDLGVRGTGTGVGCAQITGTPGRSLVGLNVHLNPAGQPDSVHRTQIILTGTAARNGATDTIPTTNNPSAAQSGNTISCGNLTMTHDGITERN